jgi:hypothetical protein
MIVKGNTQGKKVPNRAIIAAITMLTGIVLMGLGYFQINQVMVYAGLAITLSGVMVEAITGIIGSAKLRRRGRIARV